MRRSYTFVFAAVLAAGCFAVSAAPINLIANGGFETGVFAPWTASGVGPSGFAPSVVSSDAHTGTRSALFPDGTSFITETWTPIPVADIFEISFWLKKADPANPGIAAITFRYEDPSYNNTSFVSPPDNWTLFNVTSQLVGGQNLRGIRIFGGSQDAQFNPTAFYPGYIDDVVVIANVPEPGIAALMSLALAGLVVSRRRKQ